MIEDFFKSEVGIIIVSIIWGLGLAVMFKKSCDGQNCKVIEYRGPPVRETKYHWTYGDDKCYTWHPYVTACKKV